MIYNKPSMPHSEFERLKRFQYASSNRFRPTAKIPSRRTSKSASSATGQRFLLKAGRIVSAKIKYISWKK